MIGEYQGMMKEPDSGNKILLHKQSKKRDNIWGQGLAFSLDSLAKYRIELFGDVVLFVFDLRLAQFDDNIWISLPIDISGMKISSLRWIKTKHNRATEKNEYLSDSSYCNMS